MTIIEIFKNEIKCIKRQHGGMCNNKRDCQSCDLVMDDKDIVFAYEKAIAALKKQIPKKPKIRKAVFRKDTKMYTCRFRGAGIILTDRYCCNCGQAIDRSDM